MNSKNNHKKRKNNMTFKKNFSKNGQMKFNNSKKIQKIFNSLICKGDCYLNNRIILKKMYLELTIKQIDLYK